MFVHVSIIRNIDYDGYKKWAQSNAVHEGCLRVLATKGNQTAATCLSNTHWSCSASGFLKIELERFKCVPLCATYDREKS